MLQPLLRQGKRARGLQDTWQHRRLGVNKEEEGKHQMLCWRPMYKQNLNRHLAACGPGTSKGSLRAFELGASTHRHPSPRPCIRVFRFQKEIFLGGDMWPSESSSHQLLGGGLCCNRSDPKWPILGFSQALFRQKLYASGQNITNFVRIWDRTSLEISHFCTHGVPSAKMRS